MASDEYVVTGEYVTARTTTPEGIRVIGLYRGAPLPPDVPEADLAHLVRQGLVHKRDWQPPTPADELAAVNAGQAAAQLANARAELDRAQKAHADAQAAHDRFAAAEAERKQAAEEATAAAAGETGSGDGGASGSGPGDGGGTEPGADGGEGDAPAPKPGKAAPKAAKATTPGKAG